MILNQDEKCAFCVVLNTRSSLFIIAEICSAHDHLSAFGKSTPRGDGADAKISTNLHLDMPFLNKTSPSWVLFD
jgi:hypothetical protein